MEEMNEEIMLPGFRFHPTDEELVGFYLKKKIQKRQLSIELIKQLDIYKHDPWDLPKLAAAGEKEWYFFVLRDRKYRNSARPNRVTGAGFWKATGTDRPIYASEGSKCIGLKKSLVFYKGRAAKGIKTDWMMHEFRLPSPSCDHTPSTKRNLEKIIPANDSWAICRIFKKANSNAKRAISHSWVSPILQETPTSNPNINFPQYNLQPSSNITSFSPHINHSDNSINNNNISLLTPFNIDAMVPTVTTNNNPPPLNSVSSNENLTYPTSNPFLFQEPSYNYNPKPSTLDTSSLLFNMPSTSTFDDFDDIINGLHYPRNYYDESCFSVSNTPVEIQENLINIDSRDQEMTADMMILNGPTEDVGTSFEDQWGRSSITSDDGFPFMSLPLGLQDAWKSSFVCDSSSDISTGFSTTNKCYTYN